MNTFPAVLSKCTPRSLQLSQTKQFIPVRILVLTSRMFGSPVVIGSLRMSPPKILSVPVVIKQDRAYVAWLLVFLHCTASDSGSDIQDYHRASYLVSFNAFYIDHSAL